MRIAIALAISILLFPISAYAESILQVSHLQHLYAGGGGCAERFWLEWLGSDVEIRDIDISINVTSKGEESITAALHLDRLGFTTADKAVERTIETPRCLSGHPRLVISTASAAIGGKRINLLKAGVLRIGKAKHLPLTIGSPTNHFTGSAQKAAQLGEFKR